MTEITVQPPHLADEVHHRSRLDRLRLAAITSGCLLASIVVAVLGIAIWSATSARVDSVELGKRNSARAQCDAQYSQAAAEAFRAYESDIGDLIVIISTIAPGDERTAAANDKVAALERDVQIYRAKSDARADYLDADRPLPCPFAADPTNTTGGPTP